MKHGRMYCIYCYTNKITGKKYIGQTCLSLEERAGKDGCNYVRGCTVFGNAIKKYGWENFQPEILEDGLTLEQANEREEYWIAELNTLAPNGYNLLPGGDNRCHHDFSKQKMSEHNHMNRKVYQFTKDGEFIKEWRSAAEAGRTLGINGGNINLCCNGHSEHNTAGGYVWRYSDSPIEPVAIPREKKVKQFTLDGMFIKEYPSIKEAAYSIGSDNTAHICDCCKGNRKSVAGFMWRYADDPLDSVEYLPKGGISKQVYQYSMKGELMEVFSSASEASRKVGVTPAYISQCCLGKVKSVKGYVFKYKEVA